MKIDNPHAIIPSDSVQLCLENGIKRIELLLGETYGPSGKNIIFDKKDISNPELFKNGSKIIRNLRTNNEIENLVYLMLEDSFQKINSVSGDGTKTFFLILSYLVLNGFKNIIQNTYSLETKIGITKTLDYALKILNDKSLPITTKKFWDKVLERYIPQEDNLVEIFREAFKKIGKTGQLKIKTETGKKSSLVLERGMQISRGYFSPYFMTDTKKMTVQFENPYILVSLQKITLEEDYLIRLLEPIIYEKKPLVIVSADIDEHALATLILNKINGILDLAYIKIPQTFLYDKTVLEDLALYTNAKLITSSRDWKSIKKSNLGQVNKILLTKTKSIFWAKSGAQNELIEKRCQDLKQQILFSDSDYENEKREDRRRNFTGANAIIEIGGITDLETSDLRARTEIGLVGAQACLYEGVLPGGGLSFLQLTEELENWARSNLHGNSISGSKLVINSLIKPIQKLMEQQINKNTLIPQSLRKLEKIGEIQDLCSSYDIKQNKIKNIVDSGILDSFKSIRIGLQTAASLTYSILSIANIII
uniref:Chaperonin GroEL, chloroplastic n=2 Tax=Nannochloropsis oceanica TaxID=145522 RepID=A0A023PL69_9STRA|nr:60 kDa chaperonin [Nannochloropsis oceanica]